MRRAPLAAAEVEEAVAEGRAAELWTLLRSQDEFATEQGQVGCAFARRSSPTTLVFHNAENVEFRFLSLRQLIRAERSLFGCEREKMPVPVPVYGAGRQTAQLDRMELSGTTRATPTPLEVGP